jgi:hypothetical protein
MVDYWAAGMGSGLLDPSAAGYSAQDMRRRIALAMLMKKATAPKTFGEGLYSIGDSLGDAFSARTLERQAAEQSAQTDKAISEMGGQPAARATAGPRADLSPLIDDEKDSATPPTRSAAIVPPPQVPSAIAQPGARPPPQVSPMAQQAALTPTEQPPAFFPSTPATASSAGPSQMALPSVVASRGDINPPSGMQQAVDNYGRMQQPPPPGPRSDVAGPALNDAQASQMTELMGRPQRPQASPYAATAALETPGVQSDVPANPLARAGVTNALMGRSSAAAPPPPGVQVAQATPNVFPPVASDVKPILPGGGFPQVAPQVQPAPQPPNAGIRTVPRVPDEYVPPERDPQPEPPAKPGMGPIEQRLTRDYLNRDVDPRIKEAATRQIEAERAQLAIPYENQVLKYKADIANWQKRQEQTLGYRMGLPKQRAETEGQYATTDKTRVDAERERRGLPKVSAEADVAQLNANFQKRVGREREPFLKEFTADKEQVNKVVPMLRDTRIAKEALDSGYVISGFGADAKLNLARIAAKIGSNDAQKIANESEKYQKAMDRTISYGIMLVNGKDPRVSEGDVAQAKGLQGTPDMQEASKRKIIDIMQSDIHGKVDNYEGLRETYLRGDPQHRFFKVDVPNAGVSNPEGTGTRDILLKNPTNPAVIKEFDRLHGSGAAQLEINRAKRRMSREDD